MILQVFNATKLFGPHIYPSNDIDRITNIEFWLEWILWKFQSTQEESGMCKGELLKFMRIFRHECENKMIFEAWRVCGSNLEWRTH